MTAKPLRFEPGQRLSPHLTIIDGLDPGSRDPVHIVWNHQALCPMAVKIFSAASRARREAEILNALRHPNIVRCLGLETGRGATAYLLMEYLEGRTLRQFLRAQGARRVGVSDVMRLAIHVCAALEHMHAAGILHLDIKPSNIIVAHGRPVLFDFGIARRKAEWQARRLEGSDFYMPPEQCRGEPVSPASDVFSLGLTIYELLTGKLPFPEPSRRHRHPQLSAEPTSARAHRTGIPIALDDLILACLAKDPGRRPPRAACLVQPLHRFIASGPAMWPAAIAG
jgi:serine/threonine-protein kinase